MVAPGPGEWKQEGKTQGDSWVERRSSRPWARQEHAAPTCEESTSKSIFGTGRQRGTAAPTRAVLAEFTQVEAAKHGRGAERGRKRKQARDDDPVGASAGGESGRQQHLNRPARVTAGKPTWELHKLSQMEQPWRTLWSALSRSRKRRFLPSEFCQLAVLSGAGWSFPPSGCGNHDTARWNPWNAARAKCLDGYSWV